MKHLRFSIASFLLTMSLACGSETETLPPPADLQPALEAVVDGTIVPAFSNFAESVGLLEGAITNFCSDPSEASLGLAQQQWRATAEVWNAAALYNIGPLDDDVIVPSILFVESMRQRGSDFTNTVQDAIERDLGSDATLDGSFFDNLIFREVGLLALEILLFQDTAEEPSTDPVDVVADFTARGRKCAYAEGMADLLRRRAERVESGWTTAFLDTGRPFRDLLLEGELEDGSDPIVETLVAVIRHVEYLRRRKLQALPDAQLAGSFYDNIQVGVAAVRSFLDADTSMTATTDTFYDAMRANDRAEAIDVVNGILAEADAAALAADQSRSAAAFLALETALRRDVPIALRIDIGLTFTDGD
ncbi:MAG: imelysin family protein [Myxococcota bacterium]